MRLSRKQLARMITTILNSSCGMGRVGGWLGTRSTVNGITLRKKLAAAMLQRYSKYGVDFRVRRGDCVLIAALDDQRRAGKTIFGGGLLLSEKAAAEKAAAETWRLSPREKAIIAALGGMDGKNKTT